MIKIPEDKITEVSDYIKNIGGKIISGEWKIEGCEDKVTHEAYFGENIKRAIKAFVK
jgi:hypothetical protein